MGRNFLVSQLFFKPPYPTNSFSNQTIIVTGANSGLGREAARHFATLGASKVILAVRNIASGQDALKDIAASSGCPAGTVEVWPLDLSQFDSVKAFARRANQELQRIDVLLKNAAINTEKFRISDGHESTLTVNVISTFLLALLLYPKMKETSQVYQIKSHLSIVVSEVHGWTNFPQVQGDRIFPTLDQSETANMKKRYFLSKLLDVLLVRHLASLTMGSDVIINMLNPGLCHSGLTREKDGTFVFWAVKKLLARPTELGSRTLVAAACAGEESHGAYMSDGEIMNDMVSEYARSAQGETDGKKLWYELRAILEDIRPGVTTGFD